MSSPAPAPGIEALHAVQQRIQRALTDFDRAPNSATLVCVSKTAPPDAIHPLLVAGQRVFGENRVQEAAGKWPDLRQTFPGVQLHLIGPLQTNKAAEAVDLFDVIETLDRPRLAQALANAMAKAGKTPRLFVQVNTGSEAQKAGVLPGEADGFIAFCRDTCHLAIAGLMCIPPVEQQASPHFALLAQMAQRNGVACLSMGMSADFELALQLGATHVRVGSAIFGARH